MKTYLRKVPGGCPGYYREARSLDQVCQHVHVRVGEVVYHELELPSSQYRRLQERRAA